MPQFDLVRLQLAANHLQTLQTLLAQHVPQAQVWAYGSRVTGGAHEGSDLDLVLRNLADLTQPVEGWAALKEALQESSLPMLVEVHLWASLPAAFHRNIEAGYVVVWEAGTSLGMANEWKACSLGDVVELKRGYDLPQRERVPGDVPLVSSSGVTDTHAKAMVKGPGVVTGRYGTLGQVFYVEHDFWPLNTTLYVRDFKGNDPRFISYFLRNIDFLVYSDKAAVPGLNRNHLHQARVRIPSASTEQRAIAHILGTLDDKIELNRRMNETLEATARALFQAWFVDFEPVRAKMDGRWLPGQSLPGLPAHIYDLFPDRLVESDLGEKPHGWEITSLSKFAALNPESWTKTTRPEAIRYVDLSNTKWGRIEAVTHYRADDAPSRAQRVLQALDTIVGTVRPGNGSYALVTEEGLTGSTGFAVLRPLRLECAEFVYLAATASTNIDRLSNLADGGAYPAVSSEVVLASQVPRVGEALINEFSRRANPLFEKVAENERESYSLAQIRDTLLPQLISGELRVADAARILKGVEKHD